MVRHASERLCDTAPELEPHKEVLAVEGGDGDVGHGVGFMMMNKWAVLFKRF